MKEVEKKAKEAESKAKEAETSNKYTGLVLKKGRFAATDVTISVGSGVQVTKYAYVQFVYEASCNIMGENKSSGFYRTCRTW